MKLLVRLLSAGVLVAGATPAAAAVFDFTYSGLGVDAAGAFTTIDTPDGNGFYLITGLTGARNGEAMTLLPVGTDFGGVTTDNLVRITARYFTFAGIGFSSGGVEYSLYSNNTRELECSQPCLSTGDLIDPISFTISQAVPEPASWALMIAGFSAAGAGLRRRRAQLA